MLSLLIFVRTHVKFVCTASCVFFVVRTGRKFAIFSLVFLFHLRYPCSIRANTSGRRRTYAPHA